MVKFFACIIAMSLLYSCVSSRNSASNAAITFADNPVVAHRGAWKAKGFPENSIAALRQAITLGCTGSEFDIRITADDSLIINHDPTYHEHKVEETNYSVLRAIPLANGERLPTLREYLLAGLSNNKTTRLICEIKPSTINKERGELIAEKVWKLVKDLNASKMVAFISFDAGILNKIRTLDANAHTQYLNGTRSPDSLLAQGISGADYQLNNFKKHPEWITSAKQNNITLNAWTVNAPDDMDWLLANRFEFITTNEPELLLAKAKQSPAAKGWKLLWSDEFHGNGMPDTTKWSYAVGGNGYGNNEQQYYTNADTNNAFLKDGKLFIRALKERKEKNQYTSARLHSKGKASFKYGRIEVRAKLPAGRGTWPAIWMLGNNRDKTGWPASGEIDIMEHVGYEPDSIYGTIHTTAYNHMIGTQKVKAIFINDPYIAFHTYAIEWSPEKIDFFVDDKLYNHIENEHISEKEWPFDQPFYMILNLAVGGNWGGKMGVDDAVFPAVMEVEYVRVYQ